MRVFVIPCNIFLILLTSPKLHSVHSTPNAENVPGPHTTHAERPLFGSVPAVHVSHTDCWVLLTLPCSVHIAQAVAPRLTLPGAHASQWLAWVQSTPSGHALPAPHWNGGAQAVLPAFTVFGSLHSVHSTPNAEKFPSPHLSHLVCALFGDVPAGHATHCVAAVVLTSVIRPVSHCEHSLAPALAYWPTAQSVQLSVACVSLRNLPGSQVPQTYSWSERQPPIGTPPWLVGPTRPPGQYRHQWPLLNVAPFGTPTEYAGHGRQTAVLPRTEKVPSSQNRNTHFCKTRFRRTNNVTKYISDKQLAETLTDSLAQQRNRTDLRKGINKL